MRFSLPSRLMLLLSWSVALAGCVTGQIVSGPSIVVEGAWARAADARPAGDSAPSQAPAMSAVYLTLRNEGTASDRLVAVETDVAKAAELHQTQVVDGVARMVPVTNGLTVEPGQRVELAPGGYHIMLMGLRRSLRPGDAFTLTLVFEQSGRLSVEVEVRQ